MPAFFMGMKAVGFEFAIIFGMKVVRIFCAIYAVGVVVGCWSNDRSDRIASAFQEVSEAVFTIRASDICGRGVFVGYKQNEMERVFFLTARHVATSPGLTETTLDLAIGTNTHWSVRAAKNRWYTGAKKFDFAWFELTDDECKDLAERNALKYVPLKPVKAGTSKYAISGARAIPLVKYANGREETLEALIQCQDSIVTSRLDVASRCFAPLPFDNNRYLRKYDVLIIPAYADRLIVPGQSGAPTFVHANFEGEDVWALVGLAVGGNRDGKFSAIESFDGIMNLIGVNIHPLADHPELW